MSDYNRMKVRVNESAGSVTLQMERRNTFGSVTQRISFTLPRGDFEQAISAAEFVVPWWEVKR